MARLARGTPYNPLVADVMTAVFGPTAGEDRPQLHPRAQPAVQTLVSLADANPRFEAVRHACPSPFLGGDRGFRGGARFLSAYRGLVARRPPRREVGQLAEVYGPGGPYEEINDHARLAERDGQGRGLSAITLDSTSVKRSCFTEPFTSKGTFFTSQGIPLAGARTGGCTLSAGGSILAIPLASARATTHASAHWPGAGSLWAYGQLGCRWAAGVIEPGGAMSAEEGVTDAMRAAAAQLDGCGVGRIARALLQSDSTGNPHPPSSWSC